MIRHDTVTLRIRRDPLDEDQVMVWAKVEGGEFTYIGIKPWSWLEANDFDSPLMKLDPVITDVTFDTVTFSGFAKWLYEMGLGRVLDIFGYTTYEK